MKTVVVRDYPAEKLPEELRQDIDPQAKVSVTIVAGEPEPDEDVPPLTAFIGAGRGLYRSPEEATAFIRSLRDEWE